MACTHDLATKAELSELLSSVKALRAETARLEAKLERLEPGPGPVGTSPPAPQEPRVASAGATAALPALTVVKLKPRREAPPPIDLNTRVSEPAPAITEALLSPSPPSAAAPVDPAQADEQWQRALEAVRTGDVEGGVEKLKAFAQAHPAHPQADNALFNAGTGFMALKDYEGAAGVFEQALQRYPAGDAISEVLLKLGECRLKKGNRQEARDMWARVVASFPGTPAASAAQARLSSLPDVQDVR